MTALQVWASEFHPREVYELKMSHVQHFTSGIHRPNGRLLEYLQGVRSGTGLIKNNDPVLYDYTST